MRPIFFPVLLGLILFAFAACSDNDDTSKKRAPGFHDHHDTTQYPAESPAPDNPDNGNVGPAPEATPTPEPTVTAPAETPPPHQKDYPYGIPEAGRPGFVRSPYSKDSGLVDVRGYPPGTEVTDPYTQKIFLVP
jgi:hypothetical protein